MLSTKVHKARQLASHALPLTRRILSLGKGLLHKVTVWRAGYWVLWAAASGR